MKKSTEGYSIGGKKTQEGFRKKGFAKQHAKMMAGQRAWRLKVKEALAAYDSPPPS